MLPETTPENQPEIASETRPEIVPAVTVEAAQESVPVAPPKKRWQRLLHWEYFGLSIIVLITMIFHFAAIVRPPTIVWDEKWYVGDARSILSGPGDARPEHPPLGKLYIIVGDIVFNGFKTPFHDTGVTITADVGNSDTDNKVIPVSDASLFKSGQTIKVGMEMMDVVDTNTFSNQLTVSRGTGGSAVWSHTANDPIILYTDTAFGWRFFSIIFGTVGIILVYLICRKLKFSWKAAMIATFLFAFEDMTFIHSGLALLDVYMVTFMLAAVLMYVEEKYLLMGLFIALSAECKLLGVLIIFAIFIHWAIFRKDKWKEFAGGLIVSAVSFVVLLVGFDFFLSGKLENPVTRITSMLTSESANKFTDPKLWISSRPWTWIYPQWLDPTNSTPLIPYNVNPQYISFISTTIQLLILPSIGYMIYKTIKKNKAAALVVLWFIATYVIWIPLDIYSNRTTYVFYFLCTTPAICIGIAMAISDWLEHLKSRQVLLNRTTTLQKTAYVAICAYLLLHLAIFIVFNPAVPVIFKTMPFR
jgi:dolichyl-phosphate-mannose--protein O-mannosyl transferase